MHTASYFDHPLQGDWSGYREFHIEPDWVVIYRNVDEFLVLERTGTHSDLFKK
ncbi:MAG: type II toxin-antitoxin system YafQ family toxin [Synergistaceae bacterium]|nr:type II toxin-antitoxin system YafQ family toxin [Synergistaceae bacterium]